MLKGIGDIENLYCILFSYFFFHLYCCLQSYIWPVMLTYGPKKAIQYMPHLYNAHYWNSLPSWSCLSEELDVFCGGHEQAHILLHLRSLTVDQRRMMQLCNVNKTFLCNYQKKYVSKKAAFFVRSFVLPICFYHVLVRKHMLLLWKEYVSEN